RDALHGGVSSIFSFPPCWPRACCCFRPTCSRPYSTDSSALTSHLSPVLEVRKSPPTAPFVNRGAELAGAQPLTLRLDHLGSRQVGFDSAIDGRGRRGSLQQSPTTHVGETTRASRPCDQRATVFRRWSRRTCYSCRDGERHQGMPLVHGERRHHRR